MKSLKEQLEELDMDDFGTMRNHVEHIKLNIEQTRKSMLKDIDNLYKKIGRANVWRMEYDELVDHCEDLFRKIINKHMDGK